MRDLTVRLDALDPQASAALRVIAYFDDLTAHGATLQAIVRGAAVLAAVPAALVDEARRVRIRVDAQGRTGTPAASPDPAWPSVPAGSAVLWLEHSGPPRPADAMVLERAAAAATAVLDRTRGRADPHDTASVETLLDPASSPQARTTAARRLGLPASARIRAVALHDGTALLRVAADPEDEPAPGTRPAPAAGHVAPAPEGARAGVGPAVDVDGLPDSWEAARTALRLTAEGTPDDPGPRVVHADEAGGLLALARAVGPDSPKIPDVTAVEHAARAAPWVLATLDAVAGASSVRAAAAALRIHHSTLQERLAHAERLIGWSLADTPGRFRLHLALVLRRLHRPPPP
ncbi:helix-turn-helix domain-containing protein [Spirillospora sp. NPDC052242]